MGGKKRTPLVLGEKRSSPTVCHHNATHRKNRNMEYLLKIMSTSYAFDTNSKRKFFSSLPPGNSLFEDGRMSMLQPRLPIGVALLFSFHLLKQQGWIRKKEKGGGGTANDINGMRICSEYGFQEQLDHVRFYPYYYRSLRRFIPRWLS